MICTNDLVVTPKDYRKMIKNIDNHPMLNVICGVCNVDHLQEKDFWNICFNLPDLGGMNYQWVKAMDELRNTWLRVKFAGFPFMCIKRALMNVLKVRPERPGYDGCDLFGKDGFAADNWFCHALYELHEPIYCDTSIEMDHLRYEYDMQVGKKEPNCELHTGSEVLNVTDECYKLINVTKEQVQSSCKKV